MKVTYFIILSVVLLSVENVVPRLLTSTYNENHSNSGLGEVFLQKYNTETLVGVQTYVKVLLPLQEKSTKINLILFTLKTPLPHGETNTSNADLFNIHKTINPVALESEDKAIKSDRTVRLVFEELSSVIEVPLPHEAQCSMFLTVPSTSGVSWHCSGTLTAMAADGMMPDDARSVRVHGIYADWSSRTDTMTTPNGANPAQATADKMLKYLQTSLSGAAKTDAYIMRMSASLQMWFVQYKTVGNISLPVAPQFGNCNLTGLRILGPVHNRWYTRRARSTTVNTCPCVFVESMICSDAGEGDDMCYDWGAGLVCQGSHLMKKTTCNILPVEDKACSDDDTTILSTTSPFEMKSWVDRMFGTIGIYSAIIPRTMPTTSTTRRPKKLTTYGAEDHTKEYGHEDGLTSPYIIRIDTIFYMCSTGFVVVYTLLILI